MLIFYAWAAIVSLSFLLMYIGTQYQWPGDYILGVAFGVVGVAACPVVTLLPSRRIVPALFRPAAHQRDRRMTSAPSSSSVILRTTLVWSAVITGILAVIGATVGYLVAGPTGLASALVGVRCSPASSSG